MRRLKKAGWKVQTNLWTSAKQGRKNLDEGGRPTETIDGTFRRCNRPVPCSIANIPPAENPLLVNYNLPDEIPADALKVAPYKSAVMLGNIILGIWEEVVPEDWKEGFLVKLIRQL